MINSYNLLDHNEIETNDTDNTRNISFSTTAEFNHKIKHKSKVNVNQFPDHDVLRRQNVLKVVSKITANNKCVIIRDSITKRIDMRNFNKNLKNGSCVKRAFPGATASQIMSYVPAILKDDLPDTVIICAGTNNITKRSNP